MLKPVASTVDGSQAMPALRRPPASSFARRQSLRVESRGWSLNPDASGSRCWSLRSSTKVFSFFRIVSSSTVFRRPSLSPVWIKRRTHTNSFPLPSHLGWPGKNIGQRGGQSLTSCYATPPIRGSSDLFSWTGRMGS